MSPHLLSLPTETIQTIISSIVHPIDAYNLSRTCKHLNTLLISHSNLFWYNLLRKTSAIPSSCPYNPELNYHAYSRGRLHTGACHMCFAQDSLEETKQLGKMGLKRGNRAFGPRVCISCFNEHTVSKPHHSQGI